MSQDGGTYPQPVITALVNNATFGLPAAPPPPPTSLTVAIAGTGGGTVTSNPAGITCPTTCSATFTSGSSVTLTASPAPGSTFTGWSGGVCSGGAPTCTFTLSAAQTVTATFDLQTFTLTVTKSGTGTGTVTSARGIDCGLVACSVTELPSVPDTLHAAGDAGSMFAGWGAACTASGAGDCTLTVTAAGTVDAIFNHGQTYNLTIVTAGTGADRQTSGWHDLRHG